MDGETVNILFSRHLRFTRNPLSSGNMMGFSQVDLILRFFRRRGS